MAYRRVQGGMVSFVAAIAAAWGCTDAPDDLAPTTFPPPNDAIEAGTTDAPTAPAPADATADVAQGWIANGVKDGAETDVDCGGTAGAPACAAGKACKVHDDCAAATCRYDGVCIAARSCAAHFGGDTCGPDGNEDCCKAIPVPHPTKPYVLDKYSVTAGRFRQFVERTKGDIRGWLTAHRPKDWDPVWDAWLPSTMDTNTYDGKDGVVQQLGPHLYYYATGANMGCQVEEVGARTYWLPPAVNTARFNDVQRYDKDTLDQKPMVCATYMMLAAFCAWDGGRIPSLEELDFAWNRGHPESYFFPWGNSPRPAGWVYAYDTEADALSFGQPHCNPFGDPTSPCDRGVASWRYNSWTPGALIANDRSVFIPPPGHFPRGDGPFGHADLAGLVFNVSSTLGGQPGDDPVERISMYSRGGTWQGHAAPYYDFGEAYGYKLASKYWATGARCAR